MSAFDFSDGWSGCDDSACGAGSLEKFRSVSWRALNRSRDYLRETLGREPKIIEAGCGDLKWHCDDLPDYAGFDLHEWPTWPAIREKYELTSGFDITIDQLPECDLIVCRAVLIHLPTSAIESALALFERASQYALVSSCQGVARDADSIPSGGSKKASPFDPTLAPFHRKGKNLDGMCLLTLV